MSCLSKGLDLYPGLSISFTNTFTHQSLVVQLFILTFTERLQTRRRLPTNHLTEYWCKILGFCLWSKQPLQAVAAFYTVYTQRVKVSELTCCVCAAGVCSIIFNDSSFFFLSLDQFFSSSLSCHQFDLQGAVLTCSAVLWLWRSRSLFVSCSLTACHSLQLYVEAVGQWASIVPITYWFVSSVSSYT